jgi:hypothetical protein
MKVLRMATATYAPHYRARDEATDPDGARLPGPILHDGKFFLPAEDFRLITHGPGTAEMVTILTAIGNAGIAVPMSPVRAREIADNLRRAADEVDESARKAADALIAAARAKGGAA